MPFSYWSSTLSPPLLNPQPSTSQSPSIPPPSPPSPSSPSSPPSCLDRDSVFFRVLTAIAHRRRRPPPPSLPLSDQEGTTPFVVDWSRRSITPDSSDSSDEEDSPAEYPPSYYDNMKHTIYKPHGNWAWADGLSIDDSKIATHLSSGRFCSADIRKGILGGRPITYVSKSWQTRGQHRWLGFHSELALYKSEQHLKPLQGTLVPSVIGVYVRPGEISIAMEPPHHSFWVEASSDMPDVLKERCIAAFEKLHVRQILHDDVELRHMLIGGDGKVTIIDFQGSRSLVPNPDVKLERALPEEFRMEMRKVKVKLNYRNAREQESRKMEAQEKRVKRNKSRWRMRERKARGEQHGPVSDDEADPPEDRIDPPVERVDWEENWVNSVVSPRRFVMPGQSPEDLEREVQKFLAIIERMQSKDTNTSSASGQDASRSLSTPPPSPPHPLVPLEATRTTPSAKHQEDDDKSSSHEESSSDIPSRTATLESNSNTSNHIPPLNPGNNLSRPSPLSSIPPSIPGGDAVTTTNSNSSDHPPPLPSISHLPPTSGNVATACDLGASDSPSSSSSTLCESSTSGNSIASDPSSFSSTPPVNHQSSVSEDTTTTTTTTLDSNASDPLSPSPPLSVAIGEAPSLSSNLDASNLPISSILPSNHQPSVCEDATTTCGSNANAIPPLSSTSPAIPRASTSKDAAFTSVSTTYGTWTTNPFPRPRKSRFPPVKACDHAYKPYHGTRGYYVPHPPTEAIMAENWALYLKQLDAQPRPEGTAQAEHSARPAVQTPNLKRAREDTEDPGASNSRPHRKRAKHQTIQTKRGGLSTRKRKRDDSDTPGVLIALDDPLMNLYAAGLRPGHKRRRLHGSRSHSDDLRIKTLKKTVMQHHFGPGYRRGDSSGSLLLRANADRFSELIARATLGEEIRPSKMRKRKPLPRSPLSRFTPITPTSQIEATHAASRVGTTLPLRKKIRYHSVRSPSPPSSTIAEFGSPPPSWSRFPSPSSEDEVETLVEPMDVDVTEPPSARPPNILIGFWRYLFG